MKFLVLLCFAAAMAAPATTGDVTLLKSDFTHDATNYAFDFEQSDGHIRKETGVVKNVGAENEHIAVTGSFSFPGSDGTVYTVSYVPDEYGFQPTGVHLKVAPTVYGNGKHGIVKNAGAENENIPVTGSFSFVGDDGQTY